LPDHRQAGKVNYPLPEVLLLILLEVLAGAEAFTFRDLPAHRLQSHPKGPGKDSIRLRRKTAGWDDEYLASLIAA
jgi:hypothetical protein